MNSPSLFRKTEESVISEENNLYQLQNLKNTSQKVTFAKMTNNSSNSLPSIGKS